MKRYLEFASSHPYLLAALVYLPLVAIGALGVAMIALHNVTDAFSIPLARSAAQRALALEPGNADAHAILGTIAFSYDYDAQAVEDAWQLMRVELGSLPRAVNFISGPSRTADIEQTVTLGAHGPYRVHIILVGGSS